MGYKNISNCKLMTIRTFCIITQRWSIYMELNENDTYVSIPWW